LRFNFWIWWL